MKQLLWLLIVLTGLSASGQYDYTPSCERAHALVTSLRFEEARIVLDSVKAVDPGNLVPILLDNYIDFLTIIVGEDEAVFNRLEPRLHDRIDLLKEGDKRSPCIAP